MVRARYPGNTTPGSLARELAPQRLRELPSAAAPEGVAFGLTKILSDA